MGGDTLRKISSFYNNDGVFVHALFFNEQHYGTYATREEAETITKEQVERSQSNLDL